MAADEDGIGARQVFDIGLEEVPDVDVDARCAKAAAVLLHQCLALGPDLKGLDIQMRELQARLDGHAARAETDVPQDALLRQLQGLHGHQAYRSLGDHLLPAVKQGEFALRNAVVSWSRVIADQNQAVGIVKFMLGGLFERKGRDTLLFGIAQVLTHIHLIAIVAIFQHAAGDGGGRVLVVGEYAYLAGPLDECPVKFGPGTPRQRDDAQIIIRHHQAMHQQLQ